MTDNTPGSTGLRGSPGRVTMLAVGLLAGGVTAFVLVLLAAVANVVTPWQVPLTGMAAAAGIAGLGVAADGARQQSPGDVIVRCSSVVAPMFLLAGLLLGGYVWTHLGPAARQERVVRYAPAVPVVVGGVLATAVWTLGTLFKRHLNRDP